MKSYFSKRVTYFIGLVLTLSAGACVEPIDFETEEDFDSALVVEGSITNELKKQEVKITRTYRFEEGIPPFEVNAKVMVTDDVGSQYEFEETEPGIYLSKEEFQAEGGRAYQLKIETSDGSRYISAPSVMAFSATIQEVKPVRVEGNNGRNGVALILEGNASPGGNAYYRYEFIETFKIQSPYFKSQDLIVVDGELVVIDKTKEEYTCYRTEYSEKTIVASTEQLSEDRVNGLTIQFLEVGDPKMSHRYSILVKQYGLTPEAHRFYETLKNLSESESIFSQIQPGFLAGNLVSVDNPEEMVLGYFSVSEVTTKRTFFSFTDFFEAEADRTPFVRPCEDMLYDDELTKELVLAGSVRFFLAVNPNGPYRVIRASCVDCTLSGSNVVPEFWIED